MNYVQSNNLNIINTRNPHTHTHSNPSEYFSARKKRRRKEKVQFICGELKRDDILESLDIHVNYNIKHGDRKQVCFI